MFGGRSGKGWGRGRGQGIGDVFICESHHELWGQEAALAAEPIPLLTADEDSSVTSVIK